MQIVPSELTHHEHLSEGELKYNIDHIKSIENAGAQLRKPAAQIFLEEWITSGRIRPTLSHLLQLLIKSELFRAADYVAINLLSEAPPQRPSKGPAAKINIALPQDDEIDKEMLNGNYPNSSEIFNLNRDEDTSKIMTNKEIFDRRFTQDVPMNGEDFPINQEDLIRSPTSVQTSRQMEQNNSVTPQPLQTRSRVPTNSSSQIQPSDDSILLPHISAIFSNSSFPKQLNNPTIDSAQNITSSSSIVAYRSDPSSQFDVPSESPHNFVPNFSLLKIDSNGSDSPNSYYTEGGIPNLSMFNIDEGITQSSTEQHERSGNIPQLSELMNQSQSSSDSPVPVV